MAQATRRRWFALASCLAAAPHAAPRAQPAVGAAPSWPQRPVRVIAVFSPGSTPDIAARAVAPHLQAAFGQPFVVENRTGAGGLIGTDAVAKATDGHTLGVATNGPIALARSLYRNLAYDPVRDLVHISLLVRAPQILVVNPRLDVHDAPGLVRLAKARAGRLTYGSVGVGAGSHLSMEALKATQGIDLANVIYRGFPEAVIDLVAGRTDAMFAIAAAVLEQLRDGRLRAIAVTSAERFAQAPEIPTLAEQGLAGMESYSWIGLIGPSSTPADVVKRLSQAARDGFADPQARGALERAGFEVVASTPEAFRAAAAEETRVWGGLIERLGIKTDG
jgi:tripartite-type tricarboxylate transporter receptor subunit TctC